nr:putative ribonuclease H-like domain-containing protein [Tanacetum cinerariifolium]
MDWLKVYLSSSLLMNTTILPAIKESNIRLYTRLFLLFSWAFFLETKDETFYILKDFIALIENQLNKKVKAISYARTPQQNGVAERKNRTLIEVVRSMLADSKLPTMFWTEAVSTACYVLNKVSITNPHNKTPYELLSGKVPNIRHLKPFRCQVTILNTSDHLGKFDGKANDGFLVGYAAYSKAYRVYNLSSKKVKETLNLRYLEDKPNVQGLGQEWYFDLDYLTDSLDYTRFQTNPPAYTYDTNIITGTQDDDSESECDEQTILVPSFPSNSFSGLKVNDISAPMENNLDYAKELARLQKQEHEAHSATTKMVLNFPMRQQRCCIKLKLKLVGIWFLMWEILLSCPAGSVPASHVPASSIPAGGVLTGSINFVGFGDPAASESVLVVFTIVHAAVSPLPPGHSLGSSEHSIRFPSPSDLGNHQPTAGIFFSSSYDDDSCVDVTNLASSVAVDPVATKWVNTIHPQSQIIRELQSPVQTRSTVQNSKFGESAFFSYVHNQNRTNRIDHLHCLFGCFLSQLKPSSVAKALEDPDWIAIGTKWILKNKRDARGIVVRNKARLVAQGHRQEEGIDYDEVFASVARIEAIRLFLAFASYMGFMVYQIDIKSAFLYGEIKEGVRGTIDKTLFLKKDSRHIILVQVYVDDIIFGSMNKFWCDEFEVLMKGEFEMSVMGELTFFLGLQVTHLPNGIFISQDKYVKDMLKKFDIESVRTATTPYEIPKHKSKDEPDDAVNVHLYRSIIGSLMYLTASRPDIMFAVSACSRHQVAPLTSHLNAVKKIFKYLKGQPTLGLWYPIDSPFQLEAYSDSDYAGSHGDRKSTTGGCQFLGRRLISWQCKKQTVVATSFTKAEYVVAASYCGQASNAAGSTGVPASGTHSRCWIGSYW